MAEFAFSDAQKRQFEEDGCLVIENFLSDIECDALRQECSKLVENIDPEEHKTRFSTNDHEQMKDDYFLSTNGKIGFFWETEAMDDKGNLLFPKHNCLNKIGHALHTLSPSFKKITFDQRVSTVLRKLGYIRPVVPQSMYIFKPPGIGGAVNRHIDATFLYSEPLKLMGFWIALEDATMENSCLKFVKGSHKTSHSVLLLEKSTWEVEKFLNVLTRRTLRPGLEYTCINLAKGFDADVSMRMVRNPVKGAYPALVFEGSMELLPFSQFEAAPVKKGSLVLIDGKVQHCSDKNTSNKTRHIYTFHVTETFESVWSDRNWLQPGGENMFPTVYDDSSHLHV